MSHRIELPHHYLRNWTDQVSKHGVKNISKVLIGNKSDAAPSERVSLFTTNQIIL